MHFTQLVCFPLLFMATLLQLSCSVTSEDELEANVSDDLAIVTNVECTGGANDYTLFVTILSPDTGCEQYADWWEVFTPDSTLIYRRILAHSHVDEQPFTRSGGIVDVGPNQFIYVRAHMNNLGYGNKVFSGTVGEGLVADSLDLNYAKLLETTLPLPIDCDF